MILQEWDPDTKEYTGRQTARRVTYVADVSELVGMDFVCMVCETLEASMKPKNLDVITPPCPHCGQVSIVTVDRLKYKAWLDTTIQDAFPDMPADQREMLLSGFHPLCWKAVFGGKEE